MEGNHCLTCSRPTLDHLDSRQGGPDNFVLLDLDRANDVPETSCPRHLQGCDESTLPFQSITVSETLQVAEEFVLESHHRSTATDQMTATLQPHGLQTGGPVERFSNRGSPIDDHRLLVGVPHTDPSDVEDAAAGLRLLVDAPEDEGCVTEVQVLEPGHHLFNDGFPLETGLVGAAAPHLHHAGQTQRPLAGRFKAGVGVVDVGLLEGQFRVPGHGLSSGVRATGSGVVLGGVVGAHGIAACRESDAGSRFRPVNEPIGGALRGLGIHLGTVEGEKSPPRATMAR